VGFRLLTKRLGDGETYPNVRIALPWSHSMRERD
jgi:hypothetical protein